MAAVKTYVNNWYKVNEEWWLCFHFDVCLHNGSWHVCDPYGHTFKDGFDSAELAMKWADWFINIPE